MKEVFSNSLYIVSYKFLKKSGVVNKISCTYFLDHALGKTCFTPKNVVFGHGNCSKGSFRSSNILWSSFQISHNFFKKNWQVGINYQTGLKINKKLMISKFQVMTCLLITFTLRAWIKLRVNPIEGFNFRT